MSQEEFEKKMKEMNPNYNNSKAVTHSQRLAETNGHNDAISDVLLMRMGGTPKLTDHPAFKEFAGEGTIHLLRHVLQAKGIDTMGLNSMEVVTRAHSSSDFGNILNNSFERIFLPAYEAHVQEWKPFARQVNVSDYRQANSLKLDITAKLEEIPEGGEYKESSLLTDEKAVIQVKKFGGKASITDVALVNDDWGYITKISSAFAAGASRFQSDKVWNLIHSNAKALDGVAMFHASHGNLAATGTALSQETLSAGRIALYKQKSPLGNNIAFNAPVYLIVPPELEIAALKLITEISPSRVEDANVFSFLKLIVDNNPSNATTWYLSADQQRTTADGIVYAYLNGKNTPTIESQRNFNTKSMDFTADLAFDAKVWGYQSWYKNPGA